MIASSAVVLNIVKPKHLSLKQGWATLAHKIHFPAEFSLNPDLTLSSRTWRPWL